MSTGGPESGLMARMDPIVAPGNWSSHLHNIAGGNAFAMTMDYALTQKSTCTTAAVKVDFSNYWVPRLVSSI